MGRRDEGPDLFEYAAEKARRAAAPDGDAEGGTSPAAAADTAGQSDEGAGRAPARKERKERKPRGPAAPTSGPRSSEGASSSAAGRGQNAAAPPESDAEPPAPGSREAPVTVSALVRKSAHAVERALGTLWVEGEIASLSRAASGHLYFVLKDERAEVRAVMWRSDVQRLKFRIDQGMAVLCRVKPTIYEQGGKFQIYVGAIEPAGLGADALALEQLKAKLAAEGLFDSGRKRPIPRLPRRIGVVTSKSGAAVRDIIRATQRRFPVPILIADAPVQGERAARHMIMALGALARCDVDVIILGRGGGSSSDLSAFNDEKLVRTVAACPIPIISAVGHEVDVSLTDLAADRRAATPTMAGEMAVPVLAELQDALTKAMRRLRREIDVRIAVARQELDTQLSSGERMVSRRLSVMDKELAELRRRVLAQHPRARLVTHRGELQALGERATAVMRRRLDGGGRQLGELAGQLAALSPLQVLERGYALATVDDQVVKDAATVEIGTEIDVRLRRGTVHCRAEKITPADDQEVPE